MFENRKYRIMLEEVERFLKRESWTDKELLKLKDDIRSLALYGSISDFECSQLLEKLPNIHAGAIIEEEPVPTPTDEEETPSQMMQLADTPINRFYNDDMEKVPEKVQAGGFGDFENQEIPRFYNASKVEEPDDVPPPQPQTTGFESFGSTEVGRFFNSIGSKLDMLDDDDSDEDILPNRNIRSSGFDSLF